MNGSGNISEINGWSGVMWVCYLWLEKARANRCLFSDGGEDWSGAVGMKCEKMLPCPLVFFPFLIPCIRSCEVAHTDKLIDNNLHPFFWIYEYRNINVTINTYGNGTKFFEFDRFFYKYFYKQQSSVQFNSKRIASLLSLLKLAVVWSINLAMDNYGEKTFQWNYYCNFDKYGFLVQFFL